MRPPSASFSRSRVPRRQLAALLLGVSLVAAACGSSASTAVDAVGAAPSNPSGESGDGSSAASAGDTVSPGDTASAEDTAGSSGDEAAGDPAAGENLFPDLEVLDVATGEPVNLAEELGGGDTPVLLWFWAPH